MEPLSEIAKRIELSQSPANMTSSETSDSRSECGTCAGEAYVRTDGGVVPCPECSARRWVESQLPLRYRHASLSQFPERIRSVVFSWLRKPGDGLLLTGPCGSGKTHLAATVVAERARLGDRPAFRRCADLYQALRDCFRRDESESVVLSAYVKPGLLILDDLGTGSLSDFERRYTLELLDRRLNSCRPTVVTTNWTIERISGDMDDRIASRLAGFLRLELVGEDRRISQ